jgi:hypothetical protein
MLEVGADVPDATVFRSPGEAVTIRDLAAEGALLLLFYLFDWTST